MCEQNYTAMVVVGVCAIVFGEDSGETIQDHLKLRPRRALEYRGDRI